MSQPSRKNAKSTRGRPFERGNPGRPKGSRHKVTVAIEALLEGQHEKLTQKAIDMAVKGNVRALRLCLERLAPPRKDAPVKLELPAVVTAADAVSASAALLEAVATGDVTPEEAGRIATLLTAHKALIETCDLETRLAALEKQAEQRQ